MDEDKPQVINIGDARLHRFASQFRSTADCYEALRKLAPRERDVLRLRLGLDNGRLRSIEEIADFYGMTPLRVRFIEKKRY